MVYSPQMAIIIIFLYIQRQIMLNIIENFIFTNVENKFFEMLEVVFNICYNKFMKYKRSVCYE